MAFFDELGKVISDKSKEAANRVKDNTGVLQLKSKLSAEKDKINKAYITLGKAYYDRHEQRPRIADIRYHGVKKSEREDLEAKLGLVKVQTTTNPIIKETKINT